MDNEINRPSHTDVLQHETYLRDDDEQITVWDPDSDNCVTVWMENADGECIFSLWPDERKALAERLLAGL